MIIPQTDNSNKYEFVIFSSSVVVDKTSSYMIVYTHLIHHTCMSVLSIFVHFVVHLFLAT